MKGTTTKTLRWGFTGKTKYGDCHSTAVIDGGPAKSQITIHADHLLYDDLFSEKPNVAFELIASADRNGDGEVTQAELAAVDISTQARRSRMRGYAVRQSTRWFRGGFSGRTPV